MESTVFRRTRGALGSLAVAALLSAFAAPAVSATLTVLADTDNRPTTGCSVATPNGAFDGVEARFVATVDTTQNPPRVTGITREDCTAAPSTFGAPVSVSAGGWSVGVSLGVGGSDVIEVGLPVGVQGPVRIGLIYADGGIGTDATTVAPGGGPIVVATHVPGHLEQVPTLSDAMLALLALLVFAVGWKYGRHRIAAPMAGVALVMVSLVAWAAIVLDGQVGDWAGIPPAATDPTDTEGADIVAVFGTIEGTTLFVRADARIGKPPVAVADSYTAVSGTPLSITPPAGLIDNDNRGVPAATVTSFGGGSLGGAVTTNAVNTTATFGVGGSLTVNPAGGFTYTPAAGFSGAFTFSYRITNLNGTSDAVVTINTQQAPAITSANATTFNVGTAGSFTVTATGFPAPSFSVAGALPAGVSFDTTTGVLSGTPAAGTAGTYPLVFTAANGVAPNATQNFTLTVTQGVAITSANATTFTVGQAGTFTVTTTASPTANTITFTGTLPAGVTFTNNADGTATIAGTPAAATGGTYPITITASNGGVSANGTQNFTLTVNQAPAITSANAATFLVGSAGTHTVTATGFPAPSFSVTGALPSGVTFDTTTGVLSGTPAAGTAGTYPLVFTAANGTLPNATQNFTLTVNAGAMITSANATTFTVGAAGSFTVTTSGTPTVTSVTATGALPAGVTFTDNGATGTLSGTPGAGTGGTYNLTITAVNGILPNATQSFTLTVNQAPAITSANNATFVAGAPGTFTVTATGFPAPTFSTASALPAGVTLAANGTLAGTPAAGTGGTYPITITATNGVAPDATQSFTLQVNQAPAFTNGAATTFTVGAAGNFNFTATGVPAPTFSTASALPAGVTLAAGGLLSGTPGAGTGGTYNLVVVASNGVAPNASQNFTLTVNEAPSITSANATTFQVAVAGSFNVLATGFPAPTFSTVGPLPSGVTLALDGTLSGTPAAGSAAASPYVFTITASNGVAPNGTQSFTLTVNDPAVAVDDAYNVVHDSVLTVLVGSGLLSNDSGSPAPTLVSVTGTGAPCAAFPCAIATANGSATVALDGSFTFTPNANFAGTNQLTYDILNTSGTDTGTVTITVTNAAPEVDLNGAAAGIDFAAAFTEGGGAVAIVDPTLTVADTDDANLDGAIVQITNLQDAASEFLTFTCPSLPASCSGAIQVAEVTYDPGTGTLDINPAAPAPLADFEALLRSVGYNNTSATPSGTPRDITFTLDDGITTNSPVAHATVSIAGVNNAPVLAAIEGAALAYSVSSPAVAITSTLTVADADSTDLTGATVQITANCTSADDVLAFTNQAGISGSYTAATCLMTLTGTSSVANYQAALRSVTYQNTTPATSTATRTVSFRANDGQAVNNLSNIATRDITVAVNGAPVVNAGGTLNYTENDAPTAIDTTVTVTDPDSPNLIGATVQITGNCVSTEDLLGFTTQNGITGSYSGATCTMTLSGSSSVANYQTALRSVTYTNASDTPNTTARTVTWQVNDGGAINNLSNTPTSTLNVAAANDPPVLTAGATLAYTENDAATAIDTTITVTDPDSTTLTGATVQITANCQSAQDVLGFTTQNGITGTYTAATCTMTLTGTTTLANYQTALRTVTYANTSENPDTSARTVTWVATDGTDSSVGVTSTINVTAVNDAPVLANFEVAALAYTENGAAAPISATLTVTDPDSTNLAGATVQITGNCASGQDVLAFTNQSGISGSYTAATCLMTLTGSSSVASYQAAIRSVAYSNSSDNPSTLARTLSVQVDDGAALSNLSNTVTRGITVTAVNDAPTATGFTNLPAQAGIPITYPAGKLGGTDPEGTAITINTTPVSTTNGTVTLNADGSFTFTPTPLATTASFQYTVTDSGSPAPPLASAAATVSFTVAGPAIFFVKNPAVGLANCTLGNECLFATAITGIGANTNVDIFVGDAATHTAGSTLNANGSVIGQGVVTAQTFAQFFGIPTPAEGTLATLPSLNQARPTLTQTSGTTLTVGSNNVLLGFNIGNSGGTGLAGTTFGVLTIGDMLINTAGQAISLDTGTLLASLDSVTSTGGTNNVSLTTVAGTPNLGGGALSGATGNAFNVNGGTATITYGGTIASGNARSVAIASKTGGTVTFNGAITDTDTGISLTNNTGATIAFNGGMTLSTTTNAAFTATGGGTVTASGTNTIVTTTGTAVNVASTTIGAADLNFRSITAGTGASGPANAIVLSNTGTQGGLVVTGNGGTCTVATPTCTGGQIQRTTGDAVQLTNTENVALAFMYLHHNAGSGIRGTSVNGFVLDSMLITDNGDSAATDDSGIDIIGLFGTVSGGTHPTSITNSTIRNNFEFEIQITNPGSTALADLTMSGNAISADGLQPNHGNLVNFLSLGTGNMKLSVTSGTFTGNTDTSGGTKIVTATGVQCDHSGTGGLMTCNISGATFTNNNVGPQASVAQGGQVLLDFDGNTITGTRSHGVNLFADANSPFTKSLTGRIRNNVIGTDGVANSGSQLGPGIRVQNEGSVPVTLVIENNTIQETQSFQGINVNVGISIGSALGGAATNLTILNNSFNDIGSRAIVVQDNDASTGTKPTVCVDMRSNFFGSGIAGQAGDGSWVRLRELSGTFNVRQAAPSTGANAAELDDQQDNGNDASGTKYAISGTPQFSQAACAQPSN